MCRAGSQATARGACLLLDTRSADYSIFNVEGTLLCAVPTLRRRHAERACPYLSTITAANSIFTEH